MFFVLQVLLKTNSEKSNKAETCVLNASQYFDRQPRIEAVDFHLIPILLALFKTNLYFSNPSMSIAFQFGVTDDNKD